MPREPIAARHTTTRPSRVVELCCLLAWLAGSTPQANAQTLTLTGQVLDEDERPLAGSAVSLSTLLDNHEPALPGSRGPDPVSTATSDEEGWFEIEVPEIGFWRLRVEVDGYLPMKMTMEPLLQSRTVEPVTLPRAEPVKIRVVDPRGRPVGEALVDSLAAPVWASSTRPAYISDWRPAVRMARTDSEGRAELSLAEGEFAWAEKAGYLAGFASRSAEEGGASDEHLLIELRPQPDATETGRVAAGSPGGSLTPFSLEVVDSEGRPVAGALLWGSVPQRLGKTGPDGRYTGFYPGRFPPWLYAAKHGFVSKLADGRRLEGDSGVAAQVTLEPAGDIRGVVIDSAGHPVSGVELELDPRSSMGRALRPGSVVSGRAGEFRFDGLPLGSAYVLEASPPDAPPLRRRVVTGDDIEIQIEAGATLVGRLVDAEGSGIAAGRVELFQDPEGDELPIRITSEGHSVEPVGSDAQGRFSVARIPRGRHGVLITAPGRAPKVVMDVELEDDEVRDLGELTLHPSIPLRVRVVDSEQQPIAGVKVQFHWSGHPPFRNVLGRDLAYVLQRQLPHEFETDGQGRVVIDGFASGTRVELSFSHPDFLKESQDFAVADEDSEYVLERGHLLQGRVFDGSGDGLESVRITAARQSLGPQGTSSYFVHATSGPDGRFVLKAVPAGRTLVTTRADGFAPSQRDLQVGSEEWHEADLEIEMTRGLTLRGRVTGVADADLRYTSVRVVYEAELGLQSGQSTRPDADGGFEIPGLLPGPARVSATHSDYGKVEMPLVIDEAMESVLLDLGDRIKVSGRVTDDRGRPVDRASLALRGDTQSQRAGSKEDGSFSFLLDEPGAYVLVATKRNLLFARRTVEIVDSRGDLDVVLRRGATLVGSISGLDPDSWPKVSVRAQWLDCGDSEPVPRSERFHPGSVDLDGRFRLTGLAPGRWKIWATQDGSALYAETHVDIGPGDAEVGSIQVTADLHFRGVDRTLEGRVLLNGEPAAGLTIYSAGVMTGEQGHFVIEGVERPFTLHIPGPWGSVLHRVDPLRESFVVIDIETHWVRGSLVDASGLPVPDMKLSVFDLGPRKSLTWQLTTDGLGRFEIPEVLEGDYRFDIDDESGTLSRRLTIDRDLDDLRLVLEPRVPVSSVRP